METPKSGRLPITSSSVKGLSITPGSRVLQSPLSDETIWKRLREAGFDEESIMRRDKAALIGYIAKLEAEVFDHQHHMGLLILEKKEIASKYEQMAANAEAAEIMHRRDQAAHLSALAAARKQEGSLKKALGIEKECIASLEKALHEMRAESAETKVAAESKLSEARTMVEDAQKKFVEADSKLYAAESLQVEASRYHRTAERKLQEVEAREDDLTRSMISFKAECDAKEKEMMLERQSLSERQKILQQEQERILEGQASLNQREEYIFGKSQDLTRLEKDIEAARSRVEEQCRSLEDEKSNLELALASLSKREEAVLESEALLLKREKEVLVSQDKLASKKADEIEKVIANNEAVLRTRKLEFECEMERKLKSVEEEIESKRRAWELREVDLVQREDLLNEREQELESKSRALADKEKDVEERSNYLEQREISLNASEGEIHLKEVSLQTEKEKIDNVKLDLQKSLAVLEEKKKQIDCEHEKLETLKSESNELSLFEMNIKEELDLVRAQKLELMVEADKLQVEKAKFEAEWELIDEKREELRKEAEGVADEREALTKFLKDERDSLRKERDALRDQHKCDVESFNRERADFMSKMMLDRSEWYEKIQQERADFLSSIEVQKRELENCIDKRREELESNLKEKEKVFEQEKKSELHYISSLKEMAEKELEQVALEMKNLDTERMEIKLDRDQRVIERAELNQFIEVLEDQRQKLKKQRELLRADREGIHSEVEELKNLEDLKLALDNMAMAKMQHNYLETSRQKVSRKTYLQKKIIEDADMDSNKIINISSNGNGFNSPMPILDGPSTPRSAPLSWVRRCAELIFKHSPAKYEEKLLASDQGHTGLKVALRLDSSNGHKRSDASESAFGAPKMMLAMPPGADKLKEKHDVDFKTKEDSTEISSSVLGQEFQNGKKRRVTNSFGADFVDSSLVLTENNKKRRRQQQDGNEKLSQDVNPQSVIPMIANGPVEQPDLLVSTLKDIEETSVLIIKKTIEVTQVECEKSSPDNILNQVNIDHAQNLVREQDQEVAQGGDEISLHEHMTEGMLEVVDLGDIGHSAEHSQLQGNTPITSDQKLNDNVITASDGVDKVNEKVRVRTRSKKGVEL